MSDDYVKECGAIDLSGLKITGQVTWYEISYPVIADKTPPLTDWIVFTDGPWGVYFNVNSQNEIETYECDKTLPVAKTAEILFQSDIEFASTAYGWIKKCPGEIPELGEIPEVFSNPIYPT